jgi:intracellular multiplication protein IcmK
MVLPLVPQQIEAYKKHVDETKRAIVEEKPKTSTGSRNLKLEASAEIEEVVLTPGYITSIVFYDSTGEPWPITSCSLGNNNAFAVIRPENLQPGNMINVQGLQKFANSNIVLTLQDFSLPVVVNLQTTGMKGKGAVTNSMISFRANRMGPNAKQPIIGKPLQTSISETMMTFLNGVPPREAENISTVSKREDMDLWRYEGSLYLRTYTPVIWPAWDLLANGSEGLALYKLPDVPNILVSVNGKKISLDVE